MEEEQTYDRGTNPIEQEKLTIELAILRRELGKSQLYSSFVDKWVPALIAAVVLFTAVPIANYILWKNQKYIEISNLHLLKKMGIYSDTASNITRFTQSITQLNQLYDVRSGKAPTNTLTTITQDKKTASIQILAIEKERPNMESQLIKSFRDIKVYFGPSAAAKVEDIRRLYNSYSGKRLDNTFISHFRNQYEVLYELLEKEIQQGLDSKK